MHLKRGGDCHRGIGRCAGCHFRMYVPVWFFRRKLSAWFVRKTGQWGSTVCCVHYNKVLCAPHSPPSFKTVGPCPRTGFPITSNCRAERSQSCRSVHERKGLKNTCNFADQKMPLLHAVAAEMAAPLTCRCSAGRSSRLCGLGGGHMDGHLWNSCHNLWWDQYHTLCRSESLDMSRDLSWWLRCRDGGLATWAPTGALMFVHDLTCKTTGLEGR